MIQKLGEVDFKINGKRTTFASCEKFFNTVTSLPKEKQATLARDLTPELRRALFIGYHTCGGVANHHAMQAFQ